MSSRDIKTVVDGSCLTDATCSYTVDVGRLMLFSTVHMALLARYMTQAQLVHTAGARLGRPVDVLDIGCNNGSALRLYASQSFQTANRRPVNYVGVDLDERALEDARRNVPTAACVRSAAYLRADVTKPWDWRADGSTDVIWYTEAVEHVPEDRAAHTLAEAFRVARPGCVMLLSTPAPFDPKTLVWPESHDHEFTREEMRKLIDDAGWRRVDEYGLNTNWTKGRRRLRDLDPTLFEVYEKLRRRLGPTMARTVAAALAPDACDDLVHVCVRE